MKTSTRDIEAKLIGGPRDGQTLFVSYDCQMIVYPVVAKGGGFAECVYDREGQTDRYHWRPRATP